MCINLVLSVQSHESVRSVVVMYIQPHHLTSLINRVFPQNAPFGKQARVRNGRDEMSWVTRLVGTWFMVRGRPERDVVRG